MICIGDRFVKFLEVSNQLESLHLPSVHLLCLQLFEGGEERSDGLADRWGPKMLHVSSSEALGRTSSGYFCGSEAAALKLCVCKQDCAGQKKVEIESWEP
jgi:hypothetical protein